MLRKGFILCSLVALTFLKVGTCYGYYEASENTDLRNKVSKLEEKVEIHDNELERLLQEVSDLKNEGIEGGSADASLSPVTPLEVRREVVDTGMKFTVKYKPSVDNVPDIAIHWFEDRHYFLEQDGASNLQLESEGIWETSIVVPSSDDLSTEYDSQFMVVNFLSPDYNGMVIVNLLKDSRDAVEKVSRLPRLEIEPPGDLVYGEEEDVTFKVTTHSENEYNPRYRPVLVPEMWLVNLDTGVLTVSHVLEELIGNVTETKFMNSEEVEATLKTSEIRTSGFIQLASTSRSLSSSSLLQDVTVAKRIVLRPATQTGPLPTGYFEFFEHRYQDSVQRCNTGGGACDLWCGVAGENVVALEMARDKPDGTIEPIVDIASYVDDFSGDYLHTKTVTIPVSPDATGQEEFTCRARDSTGRKKDFHFILDYYTPLSIVKEDSHVQVISENVEEEVRTIHVRISCKVRGEPQPNVTFSLGFQNTYEGTVAPDMVNDLGNKEINAVKDVTVQISLDGGWYSYYNTTGKLQSVECTATSGEPDWGYDYYQIEVPHEVGK